MPKVDEVTQLVDLIGKQRDPNVLKAIANCFDSTALVTDAVLERLFGHLFPEVVRGVKADYVGEHYKKIFKLFQHVIRKVESADVAHSAVVKVRMGM